MILIYNANGTLAGEISYLVKKMLNITKCSACEITHSISEMGEKQAFKMCRQRLGITCLHSNELDPQTEKYISDNSIGLPVLLQQGEQGHIVLMDAAELEACNGSVKEFEAKLAKLKHEEIAMTVAD